MFFNFLTVAAAQVAAPSTNEQGIYRFFLMAGAIAVFFYFIIYMPEQKRRKKLESLHTGLKKGDKVTARRQPIPYCQSPTSLVRRLIAERPECRL